MVKKTLLHLILLLSFSLTAFSQNTLEDLMQKGKAYVDTKNYEEANLVFRKILTLNEVIPSEFCYYFAETLYNLNQYQNSKNFIEKYYDLTENSGEFYQQVQQLENLVDNEIEKILQCQLCDKKGYRLQTCSTCSGGGKIVDECSYCKGKGKIGCSICRGEGVIIKVNVFNEKEYHTCHHCGGSGVELCSECKGEKTIEKECIACNGTGLESTDIICNHESSVVNP